MTLREETMDILTVPQGYYLAHCISDDFTLGAGLAKKIDEAYNMSEKLNVFYHSTKYFRPHIGDALLVDNVFNLVNKDKYSDIADLDDLADAIFDMSGQVEEKHITKLAIPHLGCGKDKLKWNDVKELIETAFNTTDIDILVCVL